MYPVSVEYKDWIMNNDSADGRVFDISGYIDAPFGRVTLAPEDLVAGSVSLEEATISSESLEVGSVFAASLNFTLYNNKPEYSDISFNGCPTHFEVGYKLESGLFEWVPLGDFIIVDSGVPANTISFKSLDKMILLSKVDWSEVPVTFPITIRNLANACFNAAGIAPLTAEPFLNENYVVENDFDGENLTARDIVSFCAQIAGCFVKMNREGSPTFRWYGDTRTSVYYDLNANEDEIIGLGLEDGALKVISGGYVEQDESLYTIGLDDRVDFIVSGSAINVSGIIYKKDEENYLIGRPEYAIELEENPLLQSDVESTLSAIYEKIGRFAYVPYTSKVFGDPAREAGDLVTFVHKNGTEYHTIVTTLKYVFRGESSLEAKGMTGELNNVKGYTSKQISGISYEQRKQELALNATTNLIANMLGGFAIQQDDAFYVADNADLSLAQKVWKWGIGGFGYSATGVDGPYTTGITADGSIVAALIEAGIVSADYVKTGNLVIGGTDGVNSIKVLEPVTGNTILEIDETGIDVDGTIGAIGFSSLYDYYGVSSKFTLVDNAQPGFQIDLEGLYTDGYDPILFSTKHIRASYSNQGETTWNTNATSLIIFDYLMMFANAVMPRSDGGKSLGSSDVRWSTVYAVNGTIQTSGLIDKENIQPIISKPIVEISPIMLEPVVEKTIIQTDKVTLIEGETKVTDEPDNVTPESPSLDSTQVYKEDFIELLNLIADKECTFNYRQPDGKENEPIPQEALQLGVIADEISDHPAYKYIGIKEELADGTVNHGLQPLPIAMLAIQGYRDLREKNQELLLKVFTLEERINQLEKLLLGGTK